MAKHGVVARRANLVSVHHRTPQHRHRAPSTAHPVVRSMHLIYLTSATVDLQAVHKGGADQGEGGGERGDGGGHRQRHPQAGQRQEYLERVDNHAAEAEHARVRRGAAAEGRGAAVQVLNDLFVPYPII